MAVTMTDVAPTDPDAAVLIEELSADLARRYELDGPEDGGFDPAAFALGPGRAFVLARVDGRAAGIAALVPTEEADAGELKRMYVAPWARGRGLARALLAKVEERARTAGYRELRLETGLRQPEAMRLYESAGYRPISGWGRFAGLPLARAYTRPLWGLGSTTDDQVQLPTHA